MPKFIKQQFYVYVLRDPRPGKEHQPIYVGKGKGRRAYRHGQHDTVRRHNQILSRTLNKIRKTGLELQVDVVRFLIMKLMLSCTRSNSSRNMADAI